MSAAGVCKSSITVKVIITCHMGFAPGDGVYIGGLSRSQRNIYTAYRVYAFLKCGEVYTELRSVNFVITELNKWVS